MAWEPLEEILKVLEFGAEKYAPDNWMYVEDGLNRYQEAAMRHLIASMRGEKLDSESGLSHLAHLGCCVLFALWFEQGHKPPQKKEIKETKNGMG
jgi:hypothetical protein